jgi:hypothetical protein
MTNRQFTCLQHQKITSAQNNMIQEPNLILLCNVLQLRCTNQITPLAKSQLEAKNHKSTTSKTSGQKQLNRTHVKDVMSLKRFGVLNVKLPRYCHSKNETITLYYIMMKSIGPRKSKSRIHTHSMLSINCQNTQTFHK